MDVRFSKDGKLVVFHDDTLDRTTEAKGPAISKTRNELLKLHLQGTQQKIPVFEEFLEFVGGKAPPSHRTEKRTRAKRSRKSDACGIKKLQGRICTAILSAEICVPDEKASPADLTRATRDDPLKRRNHARRTEMGAEKHAIPFFDQTRLYQFQYRKSSFLQSEEKKRFAPRLDGAHRRGISPRQAHDR